MNISLSGGARGALCSQNFCASSYLFLTCLPACPVCRDVGKVHLPVEVLLVHGSRPFESPGRTHPSRFYLRFLFLTFSFPHPHLFHLQPFLTSAIHHTLTRLHPPPPSCLFQFWPVICPASLILVAPSL